MRLGNNPDLTKAQIDELQKALPKCRIFHDFPLNPEEQAKVFEGAIRFAAKKPKGELTKADLEKVTSIELGQIDMTSVKGLEKLTKLKYLSLRNNKLTDAKGLEKLTQLKELFLNANQLTNVTGLEKLTKLTILDLSNNQLTDVKPLEKLAQLSALHLHNNPDLTKAQIDELRKALPKCFITSNPKK